MSTATFPQAAHTLTLLAQQDLSCEEMARLHGGYLTDLAQAVKAGTIPPRDEFRKLCGLGPLKLTVDYDLPLDVAIAAGHYDWTNDNITSENFPSVKTGKDEGLMPVLVHFGRDMSTKAVKTDLAKRKLRQANPRELLAYGAANPEDQRKFPIVALGQSTEIGGGAGVAFLGEVDSRRYLYLGHLDGVWRGFCRFLAFET